jgi:ABC-type Fe3+-hydroxamate transport system substrate-binding protein
MGIIQIKDQMGFDVTLEVPPRRIVSLVPSQTELLFDLGLEDHVVGVTKFCVHPDRARKTKTIIGGTKKFDLDRIMALRPDLIIGNKEENYPEGIGFLRERFPVWMSDIEDLPGALAMIDAVAKLTGSEEKGATLVSGIRERFQSAGKFPPLRTLYLMWYDPWMGVATSTFIHAMMCEMGLTNVLEGRTRYPVLAVEDMISLNPELILLSSEPFPFGENHRDQLQHLLPDAKILEVDGEYFSWYGSRLLKAPTYLGQLAQKLR